jgi:5-methylcytosine-specific restriction endonuclease McrA
MLQAAIDLLVSYGWKANEVRVGIRAKFRCEYCGKPLFASGLAFYEWQTDHIVPVSAGGGGGDDNLATACWHCNMKLKGSWDPRTPGQELATRSELIAAIRSYCDAKREAKDREVALVREQLKGLGVDLE